MTKVETDGRKGEQERAKSERGRESVDLLLLHDLRITMETERPPSKSERDNGKAVAAWPRAREACTAQINAGCDARMLAAPMTSRGRVRGKRGREAIRRRRNGQRLTMRVWIFWRTAIRTTHSSCIDYRVVALPSALALTPCSACPLIYCAPSSLEPSMYHAFARPRVISPLQLHAHCPLHTAVSPIGLYRGKEGGFHT